MRKPVLFLCCALLAGVVLGLMVNNKAIAQNGDIQTRVMAGVKGDVDIDGDDIPDRISLVKSGGKGQYDIVGRLSKFRKEVVLTSLGPENIGYFHVSIMNKNDHMSYLQGNRLLSENYKKLIKENRALNFVDVTYEESSAYIILISEDGKPTEMFYSD